MIRQKKYNYKDLFRNKAQKTELYNELIKNDYEPYTQAEFNKIIKAAEKRAQADDKKENEARSNAGGIKGGAYAAGYKIGLNHINKFFI